MLHRALISMPRPLMPTNTIEDIKYRTQSLTIGSTQALTQRLTNEFRFNYSRSRANSFLTLDRPAVGI